MSKTIKFQRREIENHKVFMLGGKFKQRVVELKTRYVRQPKHRNKDFNETL